MVARYRILSYILETYTGLHEHLLLLSSDVETNPGPLSESEQIILNAIESNEKRVLAEISEVKTNINAMKSEIAEVKSECLKTKSDIESVKIAQVKTDR